MAQRCVICRLEEKREAEVHVSGVGWVVCWDGRRMGRIHHMIRFYAVVRAKKITGSWEGRTDVSSFEMHWVGISHP